ncbi:hypothetical protein MRX96_016241 [Rhipicephalus microplus]
MNAVKGTGAHTLECPHAFYRGAPSDQGASFCPGPASPRSPRSRNDAVEGAPTAELRRPVTVTRPAIAEEDGPARALGRGRYNTRETVDPLFRKSRRSRVGRGTAPQKGAHSFPRLLFYDALH